MPWPRSTHLREEETAEKIEAFCESDLEAALICIEAFSTDRRKEELESQILEASNTRLLISLMDEAAAHIHDYPYPSVCDVFEQIIRLNYMSNISYSESEIIDYLGIERPSYFRYKKDAILLFGISLWEVVIPYARRTGRLKEDP